ncbi:hypothetical protein [Alkalicoccus daliensis]|uniref:hypothetical protein n=1 Tax=Alkalicoccus daliensis TaxID=745820 RepID=UPI000B81BED1|nr:hypothetical protein [Alkalicoccus daliensis]
MKNLINKIDHDDIDKVVIVAAVLAVIMAVFIPIVMVMLFQEIFFFDREQWLLSRPDLSYIVVIASFLIVPLAGITYFFTKKVWYKRHPLIGGGFVLLLMLLAFPVAYMGMMHYYYMDDEGFTYSPIASLEEEFFPWKDAEEVIVITSEGDSVASYEAIEFVFSGGKRFELEANHEVFTYRQRIFRVIEENGGEVVR